MDKLMVRCDRCGGSGIFYNHKLKSRKTSECICTRCNGTKYVEAKLSGALTKRVLDFMNAHGIDHVSWIEQYPSYIIIFTRDYVIRVPRWPSGKIGIARRTLAS